MGIVNWDPNWELPADCRIADSIIDNPRLLCYTPMLMLVSHPPRSPGVIAGILLTLALILLDLILLLFMITQPISLLTFFSGLLLLCTLPAILLIGYLTHTLPHARYHIESDTLIIDWGSLTQAIPLDHIRALVRGCDLDRVRRFRGLRWPGCYIGQGEIIDHERAYPIRFYATRPLAQQLLLVTDTLTYAVSPYDLENFQASVAALQSARFAPRSRTSPSRPFLLDWPIWQDQTAHLLLLLPALVNLLLFAYLSFIYQRLPSPTPLQIDAVGHVIRLGTPLSLFLLPAGGLVAYLINILIGWFFYQWRREPSLAYLIWIITLVVQIAAWVALLGLART